MKPTRQPAGSNQMGMIVLRLYVAGNAPNSVKAVKHLKTVIREHMPDRCQLEVVDVLDQSERALKDGVLVTPTLLRLTPLPVLKIVGDLSETSKVVEALGLLGTVL